MSTPSSRAIRRTDGAAGAAGAPGPGSSADAPDGRAPRLMSTTFFPRADPGASTSATCAGAAFAATGGPAAGAAGGTAAAFGAGTLAALATCPPGSSTLRITWPTLTLSPALTLISLTCPATDEGTSIVALSVSSSRIGWSLVTVSPVLTRMRSTSPAAMFSPSSGSVKSIIGDAQEMAGFGFSGLMLCVVIACWTAAGVTWPSRARAASVATMT